MAAGPYPLMPPPETEQSRWFALEVQPNEPALRAYLRARFPALPDVDDIIQETYRRLLREHAAGRLRQVRAFMFTVARNIALDLFRHQRLQPPIELPHSAATAVVEEQPNAAEAVTRQQEFELLAEAVRALPDRCRQVILLRYMKGCSYKEISALLGISPETVKTHLATGVERCARFLAARGLLTPNLLPEDRLP